jgi:hypothetical protein
MTHEEKSALLVSRLLDNELSASASSSLSEHMKQCDVCAQLYGQMKRIREVASMVPSATLPSPDWNDLRARISAITPAENGVAERREATGIMATAMRGEATAILATAMRKAANGIMPAALRRAAAAAFIATAVAASLLIVLMVRSRPNDPPASDDDPFSFTSVTQMRQLELDIAGMEQLLRKDPDNALIRELRTQALSMHALRVFETRLSSHSPRSLEKMQ